MEDDKERKFMHVEKMGSSVIDYVIRAGEVREEVKRIEILDRIDSDYMPVEVWIGKKVRKRWQGEK